MHNRNIQLGQLNDDLMNLLGSINAPVVMVGNDLRVRRFTPAAEKVLRLIPSDIGRPISDIKPRVDVPNLDDILRDVIDTLKPREQDVRDSEGRGYLMSVRPYRTTDNRIEGAVLILTDITELRRGLEEIRRARDYAAAIVDTVREPLLVLDEKLEVRSANRAFYDFFRAEPRQVEGAGVYIEELKKELEERGLNEPPFYGLALDDESADMEKILSDFEGFIKSVCEK
jgi:two-component system CheB/CheR fusion protein